MTSVPAAPVGAHESVRLRRGSPDRGAHPRLLLSIVIAGASGVAVMWWSETATVSGLGDWLTNAGRLTGLQAGYSMLVLVALMARVPVLERGIGADKLARWHAMGGRYAVSLVVAHVLLIVGGYAVSAHTDVVSQGVTLVTAYPHMVAASVAAVSLVVIGALSARAVRRRLPYEVWFYLHLGTYVAVWLAFAHQLSTGAQFQGHPVTRLLWQSGYATVGAAVLWFRVLTPIRQGFRHRLRVLSVRREGPTTLSVYIGGVDLHDLRAHPGQFLRWRFLTRDLWWASNPYSLSAPASADALRITVQTLGSHSRALAHLRPGTRVLASGPYGAFTAHRRSRRKVTLIAGGLGITPIRALFETLPAGGGDLTLLYRVRDTASIVFRRELEMIAAGRGARLLFVTGKRAKLGFDPLSAPSLLANVPDLAQHDVYVCGPPGLTRHVIEQLRLVGVPRRCIHHESFEF